MSTRTVSASAIATALIAHALAAQSAPPSPSVPRLAPPEEQIAAAVLPLPAELQAGATVLGYGPDGRLTRLKEGSGGMICLADDPADTTRYHVACYHESLEPFMARGRELRASGMRRPAQIDSVRFADIQAGRIRMPPAASLYSLTSTEHPYDPATRTIPNARRLFVIYMPFATAQSTGISTQPSRTAPWLMDPGTPKAHLMMAGGM